jgi:hypothetical protein
MTNNKQQMEVDIKIGFRFSKQQKLFGRTYWNTYEVVGSSYGLENASHPNWKTKEDVLKLKKYVQIIQLPYPNHNGLDGLYEDMRNSQLSISWEPIKELNEKIEEDMKLLPEFRKYKID